MIVYQLDGHGNALLQRIDGKLLCNVISTRRLKPAYIRTKEGNILTTKEEVVGQLKQNKDPFANELRRGLLPEYLEFEDAEGKQHQPPENLMVMSCPSDTDIDPIIHFNPSPQPLQELTKDELLQHFQQERQNPYQVGEYQILKGKFKEGNLKCLIRRSEMDKDHAFYISCTEGLGSAKLLDEVEQNKIKITGNPSKWKRETKEGKMLETINMRTYYQPKDMAIRVVIQQHLRGYTPRH
jgi:hypothetical protein